MTWESMHAKRKNKMRWNITACLAGKAMGLYYLENRVFFSLYCAFRLVAGVKSPPPNKCTHPPRGDPSADYLQSIVIETKDGAMVEIYNPPNSYGGVKTREIGGR